MAAVTCNPERWNQSLPGQHNSNYDVQYPPSCQDPDFSSIISDERDSLIIMSAGWARSCYMTTLLRS
ncbi:hypothetical protein GDO81_016400 [Engystomops pustulosus]|uniref:Uncharacterized protein n=1 Tax=Engystomops pustulosus TaxID=76066 RepID=A0AAV7ARU3_ENGPU|nr:hypothetical protein GDO81_016400 [Engystomops pustulosus]